jgi:hypothetical protein
VFPACNQKEEAVSSLNHFVFFSSSRPRLLTGYVLAWVKGGQKVHICHFLLPPAKSDKRNSKGRLATEAALRFTRTVN